MGAALIKQCFSGEPTELHLGHREARRQYELHRQTSAEAVTAEKRNRRLLGLQNEPTPQKKNHPRLERREHSNRPRGNNNSNNRSSRTSYNASKKYLMLQMSERGGGVDMTTCAVNLEQLRVSNSPVSADDGRRKYLRNVTLPSTPAPTSEPLPVKQNPPFTVEKPVLDPATPQSWTMSESSFVDSQFGDDRVVVGSCQTHGFSPVRNLPPQPMLRRATSPSKGYRALLPERYVLDGVVGKGTTSTCYKCWRQTDGRWFACKIIDKRRLAPYSPHKRRDIIVQLRREVEILQHVNHPNIAKLEESFENDAYLILIQELVEGGELFDAILEKGNFSEPEAVHVAHCVLSALQHLHEQGIVHRDLKPENMLLTCAPRGRGQELLDVKIIDFGFAKVLEEGATTCSFLGTGGYLAPEILLHLPYTSAVDMWAFGVLLYLLLCGRLPFIATTQLQPHQKVTSVYKLTFPKKYWDHVSPEAKDLVKQILILNPKKRLTAVEALNHVWMQQ